MLTQSEALSVVSLQRAKQELRIPPHFIPEDPAEAALAAVGQKEHDDFLSAQIHNAAIFVMESTGATLDGLASLRPAIIASIRVQYDGNREITKDAAHNAWLQPFRSYAPPE